MVALRACRLWRSASDEAVTRLAAGAVVEDVRRGALAGPGGRTCRRGWVSW